MQIHESEISNAEIPDVHIETDLPEVSDPSKRLQDAVEDLGPAKNPEDMHHRRVHFGKHKGELWTRVPISYLKWCANQLRGDAYNLACLELERRGATSDHHDVELSGHAIDRASIRLYRNWLENRRDDTEGLHSWLARTAQTAYDALAIESFDEESEGEVMRDIETVYGGMKMVFTIGRYYPILKTIMPGSGNWKKGDY